MRAAGRAQMDNLESEVRKAVAAGSPAAGTPAAGTEDSPSEEAAAPSEEAAAPSEDQEEVRDAATASEATARARESVEAMTGAAVTDEDFEAGCARAQNLLNSQPDGRAGMQDFQALMLVMGLPAARAVFRQAVRAGPRRKPAAMAALLKRVDALSKDSEVGCQRVDFYDTVAGAPAVAFLLLDECPRDHDLGAQLRLLQPRVSPARWPDILHHLSVLLFLGRSVYSGLARQHTDLLRAALGRPESDSCADVLDLKVEAQNSTLFLDPAWPKRIGLFVRFEE